MADAENSDYVVIDRVTKRFGEEMVLKETTMTMKRGKVYGIVGNNGSGKTVLMKCICGFLPVTSGSICVGQKYIGRDTDFPESLGLIIETPGFLTEYTGRKNLKKPVSKYSLGMRQRLGIAQAIMENPEFLILDEPFNGLDKKGTADIRAILLELKKQGKTILLASHNSMDIDILCDEVYEMDAGVLRRVRGGKEKNGEVCVC